MPLYMLDQPTRYSVHFTIFTVATAQINAKHMLTMQYFWQCVAALLKAAMP